jgi:hypothetical protein
MGLLAEHREESAMMQKDRDELQRLAEKVNLFARYTYNRECATMNLGRKHEDILALLAENQRMRELLERVDRMLRSSEFEGGETANLIEAFLAEHP